MPFESDRFTVRTALVGAFSVDGKVIADLGDDTPLKLSPDVIGKVSAALGGDRTVRADGTTIYVSNSVQNPAVGDLRIGFAREDVAEASIVGAQKGGTLAGYRAANGRTIFLSEAGDVPAPEMFQTAESVNALTTWIVRICGLVGMFIGFVLMLSILGIIADVIPFVGSIVGFGTSLVALVLTLLLGPAVIAIAWIAYRPLVAGGVLVAGVFLAAAVVYLRRGKAVPAGNAATFGRG